jgi:hypothetical protein
LITVLDTHGLAQPLQIAAKFGFLSEYEPAATLTYEPSRKEHWLTGPMTIRHVDLCSHNGPNERHGEITMLSKRAK